MKKTIIALAVVSPLVMSLTGCVIAVTDDGWKGSSWSDDWEQRQRDNRRAISRFEVGMSIDAVRSKLGTPDFSEVYNQADEKIQVLYYRTQHNRGDGETTKDECTPLVFKQGQLDSWGDKALRDVKG